MSPTKQENLRMIKDLVAELSSEEREKVNKAIVGIHALVTECGKHAVTVAVGLMIAESEGKGAVT